LKVDPSSAVLSFTDSRSLWNRPKRDRWKVKGLGEEARRNPTLGFRKMAAIPGSLASLPGELTYINGYRITYIRAHEISHRGISLKIRQIKID
jgi:hypothetical protein